MPETHYTVTMVPTEETYPNDYPPYATCDFLDAVMHSANRYYTAREGAIVTELKILRVREEATFLGGASAWVLHDAEVDNPRQDPLNHVVGVIRAG